MEATIIILGLITMVLSFTSGWRFGFKEEYKLFHEEIFVKRNRYRSDFWPISRTRNRKIWKTTQVLTGICGIACMVFMAIFLEPKFNSIIAMVTILALTITGFAALVVLVYRYGQKWGKKQAPQIVERTCEKFRVEFFPLD